MTADRLARSLRNAMPYLGLLALIAFFAVSNEYFLNLRNFQRLATDSATLMLVAFGMTLIILVAEIDLSVGALVALFSVVLAQLMAGGMGWPLAVALVLGLSVGIGALNGAITVIGQFP